MIGHRRIPLVDLAWQHAQVEAELLPQLIDLMGRGAFILGQAVEDFETAFATFTGVPHCIGVASGTDAIELAVRAAGVAPGDEVLLPANTFIASAAAVVRAGAMPRLVDVDDALLLMDVAQVQRLAGPAIRAVMPVHLFGQIGDMDALASVAHERGWALIEDAAQAQGATLHGRGPGSWGVAAATSFYPGKNLGAYGDAGAVLTTSAEVATTIRLLRDHGAQQKYHHERLGFNARLDALQAVVLALKLRHLKEWNQMRQAAARRYDMLLEGVHRARRPVVADGRSHVWHLYVVRVPGRDDVVGRMRADGVEVGIHYPVPLHRQPALSMLGHRQGDFPVAERAATEILSLPIYPGITETQQERVVDSLRRALA